MGSLTPRGSPTSHHSDASDDARPRRKTFDYGKEPIVVHTPASLVQALEAEARNERMIDERVAASVRELGRTPE